MNALAHAFAFALVAPVLALAMDGHCTGDVERAAALYEKACHGGSATGCSPAMKDGQAVATVARAPVMFRIYSEPTPPPKP